MVPHAQSDLTRVVYARNDKRLLASSLREKKGDAAKCALVGLMAARTKGAYA